MKLAIILSIVGVAFADAQNVPAPTGKPYAEGQAFADKVLGMIGLPNNIAVYIELSPELGWSEPQYRRVYVGTECGELYKDGKTNWRAARAITHGIAHVLDQNEQGERDGQDEADAFSGWVLHRLGATLEQALTGVVNDQARVSITKGWNK